MILESLLNIISSLIDLCFSFLPDIPKMPSRITNTLSHAITLITSNLGLIEVVVRPDTLKVIIPLLIVIINLEHIWNIVWWIMRKIPMLNIS